eukprot:12457081-Alexandrium_andersonii.AAC.1
MSASLVGSEMCIRDSGRPAARRCSGPRRGDIIAGQLPDSAQKRLSRSDARELHAEVRELAGGALAA